MNIPQNQELLCCRVCLLTDCKLYNIREQKLGEAFNRLSGTPVYKDRLPQYVCTYCHSLLLKCIMFRQKCLRTMMRLMPMLQEGEVNTDTIRKIDRTSHHFINLSFTAVQTVECVEQSVKNIKKEPDEPEDEVGNDEVIIDKFDIEDSHLYEDHVDEANTNDIDAGEPSIYQDYLRERGDSIIQNADLEMELDIDKDKDRTENEFDEKLVKNMQTKKRKTEATTEVENEAYYDGNSLRNAKNSEENEKKRNTNKVKKKKESNIGGSKDIFGKANKWKV